MSDMEHMRMRWKPIRARGRWHVVTHEKCSPLYVASIPGALLCDGYGELTATAICDEHNAALDGAKADDLGAKIAELRSLVERMEAARAVPDVAGMARALAMNLCATWGCLRQETIRERIEAALRDYHAATEKGGAS